MGKNNAGVPQGTILGPLFFLIYINYLSDGILSLVKLFADDTSLFSVVQNKNDLASSQFNNDLSKVSDWANTWKMSFNPDPSKQAQEVIFSRKCTKEDHPPIYINNIPVTHMLPFKNILGCILMKNSNTILT